jgi:predicted lysophospholipase L1 biosynthesis ABC-type transport system permease subunit
MQNYFAVSKFLLNFAAQSTFNRYKMNTQAEDIKVIREMMEKSSKFLSLSGLSGVLAGFTAIAGAAFAYFYVLRDPLPALHTHWQTVGILLADALMVLFISIGFGIYFSRKKAKKCNQPFFNSLAKRALYNFAIPLATGGVFAFVFLLRGNIEIVASSTLIFYGLALVNVSKYTLDEIHYLGLTEIVLGLLAAVFMYKGIYFWTIGFGLCHIFYGMAMYFKYDAKK